MNATNKIQRSRVLKLATGMLFVIWRFNVLIKVNLEFQSRNIRRLKIDEKWPILGGEKYF